MNELWEGDGYQHAYHLYQRNKEEVEEEGEEKEKDGNIRRQDSADDISGSVGGAAISPAIVAASRYAVMVAAAVQKQMRCCMPAVVDNQLQKFGMLTILLLHTIIQLSCSFSEHR